MCDLHLFEGSLLLPCGARYDGGFRHHRFDGVGELRAPDGTVWSGPWSGGVF
eukprot:gene45364-58000_t